jgi:hypothetical protein
MPYKGTNFVMKHKFKIILLIWPIILLLGVYWHFSFERKQINEKLLEADGLVWEYEGEQFKTQVHQREDGELLHIQIKVAGPGNKEVYKADEVIDRDMFGGGFVRAVQVDNDPENEIIIWYAQAKYYLDFVQGRVKKIPFDHTDQEIKDLAKSWHRYNVMAGLEMTILILSVLCYYILYFIVTGIVKLFKKKHSGV